MKLYLILMMVSIVLLAYVRPTGRTIALALVGLSLGCWSLLAGAQALNPAVNQANISQNICVSGWTATIRPPVSYTNVIKQQLMKKAGIPWSRRAEFELDHLIPLQLGGHPRDRRNLVLQAWDEVGTTPGWGDGFAEAHAKDVVETRMKRLVCVGKVTLKVAQQCMAHDWHSCPTQR